MSILVLAVDGPSPNVGSGLKPPYGIVTDTTDGLTIQGTGVGLGANGLAGTTIVDHSVEVTPSTIPVPQLGPGSSNVNSGLAASLPVQNATSITNPEPETH